MGEKKRRLAATQALAGEAAVARQMHAAGRLREAEAVWRRILQADAAQVDAWLGLGLLARDSGAREAAMQAFAKAVSLAPQNAEARMHYAAALQEREDFDGACAHWRAACASKPDDARLWESLGIAEQAAGRTSNAVEAYRRAIALDPTPGRRLKLATAISPIPASREVIGNERARAHAVYDELLADAAPGIEADPFAARLWTNFYLAYHAENDRELQMKAATVHRHICPSLNYVAAHCRQPAPPGERRIRVGLISQFLRNHSIGRTSRGLFAQLSRERFEVHAIFIAPVVDDEFSEAIRRDAAHTTVVARDLAQAREQIAALQLDVLFYQDIGMEPFSYFLSFARLAPVQCVSFGHPDTTGVSTIDWFVSNDLYELPEAPSHYSEKLFQLRNLGSLAYYYKPALPAEVKDGAAFGLPADRPLYLCPQNLFKVHPDMDDLIAGILRRDPRGIVVMVAGRAGHWTNLLRERWRRTMPDVQDRVVFVSRLRDHDFLNLIAIADVMLDTLHFNGMNTSLEAFAVGTPVVTLPAAFQRGRHTQAMYRRMGLDDLVARDAETYIAQAVRLANDAGHGAEVSKRILSENGTLFEDATVVREFERFFVTALHQAGATAGMS
jgi:predicted O-linked N-acetylglucosamine transferase (SPINDLY family)